MGWARPSPLWRSAVVLAVMSQAVFCQWVVETNSIRVKEPSKIAGEFDAAIGDVSNPFSPEVLKDV